jgi:hypothetical protein
MRSNVTVIENYQQRTAIYCDAPDYWGVRRSQWSCEYVVLFATTGHADLAPQGNWWPLRNENHKGHNGNSASSLSV